MRSTIEDGNLNVKLDATIEACECRVALHERLRDGRVTCRGYMQRWSSIHELKESVVSFTVRSKTQRFIDVKRTEAADVIKSSIKTNATHDGKTLFPQPCIIAYPSSALRSYSARALSSSIISFKII
jgi:hypothetical protein